MWVVLQYRTVHVPYLSDLHFRLLGRIRRVIGIIQPRLVEVKWSPLLHSIDVNEAAGRATRGTETASASKVRRHVIVAIHYS